MLRDAAVVCAVVVAVRVLWMLAAWWMAGRSDDPERAPRTGRETVVLSWCGMRGLATLALALSLPTETAAGEAFPQRAEIVLIAVRGARGHAGAAGVHAARPGPAARRRHGRRRRARRGAGDRAARPGGRDGRAPADERVGTLPAGSAPACGSGWTGSTACCAAIRHRPRTASAPRPCAATVRSWPSVQAEALAAARAEVLAARREPGVDPEAADRVLRRLDLRTCWSIALLD